MDWLQQLRLQNIFQPQPMGNDLPSQGGITGNLPIPPITPEIKPFGEPRPMFPTPNIEMPQSPASVQPPVQQQPMMSDIARRVNQYYTPEDEMSGRMKTMLDEFPEREKPGWLRRIGAAIVSSQHGLQAGKDFFDKPYNQKLKAWQDKFEPTYKAAGLERQGNVNERTLAYQTIAAELRDEAAQAKQENDEAKRKIAQQRADVYEFKSKPENMGAKIISPKGGFVTAIRPDGKATIVRDSQGQPIPTGTLSEEDLRELQQTHALERIEATGSQARQTEGVRQEGRQEIQDRKGWSVATIPDPNDPTKQIGVRVNAETGEVVPITMGGKNVGPITKPGTDKGGDNGELATQTRVRQFNAARQLFNTKPNLRKWIKIGDPASSDFKITPPDLDGPNYFGSMSGPTQAEYDEIQRFIYGASSLVKSHETPKPTTTQKRTVRNRNTGQTKTQISTDGGKTWKDE